MSRYTPRTWLDYPSEFRAMARHVATADLPLTHGPFKTKKEAQAHRAEFHRYREALRNSPDVHNDRTSYAARMYEILESLWLRMEDGSGGVYIIFDLKPTIAYIRTTSPEEAQRAELARETFLASLNPTTHAPLSQPIFSDDDMQQRVADIRSPPPPKREKSLVENGQLTDDEKRSYLRSHPAISAFLSREGVLDGLSGVQLDAIYNDYKEKESGLT